MPQPPEYRVHFWRTPLRTAHSACKSAEGREHLLVCREPAGRLLGVREPAIHGNLEHPTAGPAQLHLRAGCRLLNQPCRRTGARFIASHSTIFDLNLHKLLSRLPSRLLKTTATAPFTSRPAAIAETKRPTSRCIPCLPEYRPHGETRCASLEATRTCVCVAIRTSMYRSGGNSFRLAEETPVRGPRIDRMRRCTV